MASGMRWDRPRGANHPGWATRESNPTSPKVMPFGKHKGMPFPELSWGYLGWIMDNATGMDDLLVARIKAEMFRRLREQ